MKLLKPCISLLTGLLLFSWNLTLAQNAYIKTDVMKVSGVINDSQINSLPAGSKSTTYEYLNGMGGVTQKIAYEESSLSNDIVQIYQYDQFGQQASSCLPYADDNATNIKGSYRATGLSDQQTYYINNSTTGNLNKVANDPFPFSQQLFENSPLRRLLGSGNNGLGFQPDLLDNSQHFKVISYRNNTSADNVMVSPATGATTAYPANALSVTDYKDEDGKETLIFKNSMGQNLLKREVSGVSTEPFYDTYCVYNANGSTSYIIPPKAARLIANGTSTNINVAPLSNLIYAYTYDALGRVATRKAPNTAVVNIVYDPMNRPILLQDGNGAATNVNQWYYIKYDARNRPISQGIYTDNTNIGQYNMQYYVNNHYGAAYYESRAANAGTWYYTNNCFPSQNIQQLSFAFYDDYDLTQVGSPYYAYQSQGLNFSGVNIEATATTSTQGMLTMVLKRTVGGGLPSPLWLSSVYFYDKHSNIIQVQTNNHLNFTPYAITDYRTIAPDFTGKPLQVKVVKVTGSGPANNIQVLTSYSYDVNNERIQAIGQTYNNQSSGVTLANYSYNELGQLVTKQLGGNTSTGYLQTLDYRYNIRGQLLSINNSALSNDHGITNNDNTDLFGITYLYDGTDPSLNTTNDKPSYSGNISAVKWSYKYNNGASTSNERSYIYQYDKLGQLHQALYAERAPSGPSAPPSTAPFSVNPGGFDESNISYDDDGNITALSRNYSTNNGSGGTPLDILSYQYDTNNNPDRLAQVTDGVSQTGMYGFNNVGNVNQSQSYQYDANGNLRSDPYKNISIAYNLINKTDVITAPGINSSTINYTYGDANTVLRKQVFQNGALQTTTDYIDEFVYKNGSISYFAMPEGRVDDPTGTPTPEYIISDQQGNAHLSFEDNGLGSPVIIQENSYYGYGGVMPNSLVPPSPNTNNNNLYNGGSEWQNTFTNLPDYYQTGSRNYDPELGRFIGVDPMAELSPSLTNYHYASNNPIMHNDPTGNCDDPSDPGCNITPFITQTDPDGVDIETGGGGSGDPSTDYSGNGTPSTSSSYGGNYNNGNSGLSTTTYTNTYSNNYTNGDGNMSLAEYSETYTRSQITGQVSGIGASSISNDLSSNQLIPDFNAVVSQSPTTIAPDGDPAFGSTATGISDIYTDKTSNGVISNTFTAYTGVVGGQEGYIGTSDVNVTEHTIGLNQTYRLGFLGFTTGLADYSINFNLGENTYSLGVSQNGLFSDDSNTHNGIIKGFRNSYSITPAATTIVTAISGGAIYIYNNWSDVVGMFAR